MATSIGSQLQALRSLVQVDSQLQPVKRPQTRPSILFSPKEAADIDIEAIFNIALSGLEVLISLDEGFSEYKNDLFSHKSKELDRELMGTEENNRINTSISSYLHVLSAHFQLPAARRTLEYLIRRYKIHVYNIEDLILCALPYHDTHTFVQVVQLLNTGNSKWNFLDGVKASGAPPPRSFIVQQCIRDFGVLESLCNYASTMVKFQLPSTLISFCTAVVVEVLCCVTTVSSDIVKRILPFVVSGLEGGSRESLDHKAGSLMIVGSLANKAALSPKLVNSLIRMVAEAAKQHAIELTDLQWFRSSLMALINLVQLQHIDMLPKKAIQSLKEIRDIDRMLIDLSREFNVDSFIAVLFESLIDYSYDDESGHILVLSMIESIPMEALVDRIVSKVLLSCKQLIGSDSNSASLGAGSCVKNVLAAIKKKYPSQLHAVFKRFLEDKKMKSKKDDMLFEFLSKMLDDNSDSIIAISDSKIWYASHHPKPEVRRSALSCFNGSTTVKLETLSPQMLITIRDVILRQLKDNDLTVVQSVLSLDGISEIMNSSDLFKALHDVFKRCLCILMSGPSDESSLASDVTALCLKMAVCSFQNQIYIKEVASMIFPLLLIAPQTKGLNVKALELAKETKLPFFQHLPVVSRKELKPSKSSQGRFSPINLEIISSLVEAFMKDPLEHIPWLVRSCCGFKLSKTPLFLILMQSLLVARNGVMFGEFFDSCLPFLKSEWESFGPHVISSLEKFNEEMLHWDCGKFLDQLFVIDMDTMNVCILTCLFWRLLEMFVSSASLDFLDDCERGIARLQDLFAFLASSGLKHVLKKDLKQLTENHLQTIVANCKISPACFLSKFFTEEVVPSEVQVESLHCFAFLCSLSDDRLAIDLLTEFPSLLVPLSSDDQVVKAAAMDCVETQCKLWCQIDLSSKKNGNSAIWSNFLGEFLGLIVQQRRLILSDTNFLASFLACLLGSPSDDLLMPLNLGKRFDQSTKENMLSFLIGSALKLSDFGKLKVLSLFRRLGNAVLHTNDARSLLSLLLRKKGQCTLAVKGSSQKLSETEITLLCLLLETCLVSSSLSGRDVFDEPVLKSLQLGSLWPHDPAIERPVLTVLHNLGNCFYSGLTADKQDLLFQQLVLLFWNSSASIQNSTRDTLLRLSIEWSTFGRMMHLVLKGEVQKSTNGKKKKKHLEHAPHHSSISDGQDISFLSSLLDILQLKKEMTNREYLLAPLFELLGKVFSEECVASLSQDDKLTQPPAAISHTTSGAICFIQQRVLMILEDIISALMNATSPLKEEMMDKIDIKMVVECARLNVDPVTRNHVLAVLSSVAKLSPEKILDHMLDILTVLGESAVLQSDSYSRHVFEDLLSATVPYWLSKTNDRGKLLRVFVNLLPEVAGHRKLSIFVCLLRILGESDSLGPLLALLFQSSVSRKGMSCLENRGKSEVFSSYEAKEWKCAFAAQICRQYSCIIWLPSLVTVLQLLSTGSLHQESLLELLTAMEFILHILGDAELEFKIDSAENSGSIQVALQELMELVVVLSQIVDGDKKSKCLPRAIKEELKSRSDAILGMITFSMIPSIYFRGITHLLAHADGNVRKKALGVLCGTLKNYNGKNQKDKDGKKVRSKSAGFWVHLDDAALEAFDKMCVEIIKLVDDSAEESNTYLKLAAVLTIELLAQTFPSSYSVFSVCLASVTRGIGSLNLAVASSCLRAVSSLINVLGPRALAELPHVMEKVIKKCWENSSSQINIKSDDRKSVLVSLLVTLEAVIDKLGGFLNPYLGDILEIMVLHPAYLTTNDSKLKLKADVVRRHLTEKIPVRLTLLPLLKIYNSALQSGDKSLEIAFEMLTDLVRKMDRSSISNHYEKVFDQCLVALDVRSQQPNTVRNVNAVEKSIINAIIALTMKLTESMFHPLFLKSIEWAQAIAEDAASRDSTNLDRAITFYCLVYKLVESHRSLFVPYFKDMVKDCVKLLSGPGDVETSKLIRKKKKAKIQDAEGSRNDVLSVKNWHLRALILSSLHKCFLHDTGGLKFLESNFQVLVKPIVSQMVNEPPSSLDEHPDIPSVSEVDDLLVMCIGQMAVTAGSDLHWKPLNHEVLLQTRSEKVRARILGLRIVKQFIDKLNEEYLVLLPETIPFLGELLEDVELPVKSLAQDILKEMESMSGESLGNYL